MKAELLKRLTDYKLSKNELNFIENNCPNDQIEDTLRQLDERLKTHVIPVQRHFIIDMLKVRLSP